jgi:hypothetical protein
MMKRTLRKKFLARGAVEFSRASPSCEVEEAINNIERPPSIRKECCGEVEILMG